VRLDLNVPIIDGKVKDDFRIKKSIPTLRFLLERGAKVVLMSHIEAVGEHKAEKPSLAPVATHLAELGLQCTFVSNYSRARAEIEKLAPGHLLLLENLRMHEGEVKNDSQFAKELASLGDIYVNEAFSVSHRDHASVSAITKFIPSYAGLHFEDEIQHLSSAFTPEHPFLFILAGAKFETKLPLIEKFMGIADRVFIGGALAHNFFLEQGKDIGKSLVSEEHFNLKPLLDNPKLLLPVDNVEKDSILYDVGPETMKLLKEEIAKARYILWNGPLGAYEVGYKEPTLELARAIAEATTEGARTIIGGGDTLATIAELGNESAFTFVSTGGGAMLEYLAKGTLPGIEALESSIH
jgi:phosphoglycerate kinase